MQMLDSRGGEASQGGYNEYSDAGSSQGGGYDAPQPKAYNQAPAYSKPSPVKMPENNLPEIDINEDEIPF